MLPAPVELIGLPAPALVAVHCRTDLVGLLDHLPDGGEHHEREDVDHEAGDHEVEERYHEIPAFAIASSS